MWNWRAATRSGARRHLAFAGITRYVARMLLNRWDKWSSSGIHAMAVHAVLLVLLIAPDAIAECQRFSDLDLEELVYLEFEEEVQLLRDFPEDEQFVIEDVRVVRQRIFNTNKSEEDNWLFRAANRVHIRTREQAVRSALLFEPGDAVPGRVLAETERTLRQKSYLYDARVLPRESCGGELGVDVVVRDVWTLNPNLDFARSGGENRFSLGFSDSNTLGTGKSVSIGVEEDEDRRSTLLIYGDPNLLGTRHTLDVQLIDQDDGDRMDIELQLPFYSLDARYAYGFEAGRNHREEGLFFRSDRIAEFGVEESTARMFGGISAGMRGHVTTRWLAGVDYRDYRFNSVPGLPTPDPLPADRRHIFPWIGFERIDARYERAENIDRIHRTEDLFVGTQYAGRIGYADRAFGSDDSRFFLSLSAEGGLRRGAAEGSRDPVADDTHLIFYRGEIDGELGLARARIENMRLRGVLRYRFNHAERLSLSADARVTYTRHLTRDTQLLLGGDTGLRGYPNRYQPGDRSFILTIEERYFSDVYLGRMFRLGGALFIDVGRAWFPGDPNDGAFGVLANAGFGLRLESTRTRRDRVLHFDLAVPLHDGPNVSGVEITLSGNSSL
jgi:hypothetical protein